jgi:branched-chain amino acid transport system permease protein
MGAAGRRVVHAGRRRVRFPIELRRGARAHRAVVVTWWALVVAVLAYVPLAPLFGWSPGSIDRAPRIGQLNEVAAYAVAILGLQLVVGRSGQLSLGQSAFVGLGAYTTVILVADHGWSYAAAIPTAVVVCLGVGLAIGYPASRIEGPYLAVATLAMAYAFPALVLRFGSLTGGTDGKGLPRGSARLQPPAWMPFADQGRLARPLWAYCLVVAIAAVAFLVAHALVHSRPGRALAAVRDHPLSAAASGVHVTRAKATAFALSAAYGGLAGGMLMLNRPFATDAQFGTRMALFLVVGLVIGGVGTIAGAVPGALVYVFVPYYVTQWTDDHRGMPPGVRHVLGPLFEWLQPAGSSAATVLFGCTLLVVVFLLPGGLADGCRRLGARVVTVTGPPPWLRAAGGRDVRPRPATPRRATPSSPAASRSRR